MKITSKWFFFFLASLFTVSYIFFSSRLIFSCAFVSWILFLIHFLRLENTNLYISFFLAILFLVIGKEKYALFLLVITGLISLLEESLLTFLAKQRIHSFPNDNCLITLYDQKTKNCHPIPLKSVKEGDIIVFKENEKILVDGIIFRGRTLLMRYTKKLSVKKGDFVLAGDQNLDKEIYVQVQKEVSALITLRNKINLDRREHAWYYSIPFWFSILFFSLLIAVFIFLIVHSFSRVYFIFTCLFILTVLPFSFLFQSILLLMSIHLEKQGIYVLRKASLFDLFFTQNILFTKTGILTLGDFSVAKYETENEEDFFYYLNCAMDSRDDHIANCIRAYRQVHVDKSRIHHHQFHDGGHSFEYLEHKILVGNYAFMEENDIVVDKLFDIGTILYVAVDGEAIGAIVIADKIKLSLKDDLLALKQLGVKHFGTFSHDDERVVYAVSRTLGIKDSYSRLNEERWRFWLQYFTQMYGSKTLFISDKIEERWTEVTLLMNGIYSCQLENSDIMIVDNDMSKVVYLFRYCYLIKNDLKKIVKRLIFSKLVLLFCFLFVVRDFYLIILLGFLFHLPILFWLFRLYYGKRRG
ncbi:MAG TPA: hypothetical protein IAB56_03570 [Candidatus Scybalousia intestinigallinarum]|nr:hypothetical protein [Candidatus Scybalousia intestinigallinarum]